MTLKLFAVYVGGVVPGCHVELHDMRFSIGETIEDCFDDLKSQWWGAPESFHLDAFGALEWIDGHAISISDAPAPTAKKLWFVNLGGYDPEKFDELHKNVFVISRDAHAAKKKALAAIDGWTAPHKDNIFEVETVIDVASALPRGACIKLEPSDDEKPFRFDARYIPVGKMK